jgi:hypothetical protein
VSYIVDDVAADHSAAAEAVSVGEDGLGEDLVAPGMPDVGISRRHRVALVPVGPRVDAEDLPEQRAEVSRRERRTPPVAGADVESAVGAERG